MVRRRKVFDKSEEENWPAERYPEFANRAPSPPPGGTANDPALSGYLLKRHGSMERHVLSPSESESERPGAVARPRFGRRYFSIDDQKGHLRYSHSRRGSPSLAMPLQDVTSVRMLSAADATRVVDDPTASSAPCFEVVCPPHRLVLIVDEGAERCRDWVAGIEQRVRHWKRKAELAGPPSAVPVFALGDKTAAGNVSWLTPGRAW